MRGKASWVLPWGLGMWLVSGAAHAQCTKDTDCKGDRVCEAGRCTAPAPPAAASGVAPTTERPAEAPPTPVTDAPESPAAPVAAAPAVSGAPLPPSDQPAASAPPPLRDAPPTQRRSHSAMAGGIVMVSVGPIALIGALAARSAQERCDNSLQRDYPSGVVPSSQRYRADDCDGYTLSIYALGIGGAVLTAVGIPLIIYGSKRVPAEPASGSVQMLPWATRESGGLRLRLTL